MTEKLPASEHGKLVRVDLAKNCYLLLTWPEYERGLLRGKAERRRESNEKRTAAEGKKD